MAGRSGLGPTTVSIVPTLGVHAGVMAAISALTVPGDHIAYEHVTYAQLARSAGLIGRRAVMVDIDGNGHRPGGFRARLRPAPSEDGLPDADGAESDARHHAAARREEIVRIARAYNVWLIEDDLYGAMADDTAPLLAQLAPERTFLVGGLSKAVAAGVRGGWISCPRALYAIASVSPTRCSPAASMTIPNTVQITDELIKLPTA
jgi:DNA-binding transcriptional MocR family regulator